MLPQQPLGLRRGHTRPGTRPPGHRVHGHQRAEPAQVQRDHARLGPAQSLNAAHHGRATTKRHHGDVVLDADRRTSTTSLGRGRLHHGVRHGQLPVAAVAQQVQIGQPTRTAEPIRSDPG